MVIEQSTVSMASTRVFTKSVGIRSASVIRPKGFDDSLGNFKNYLKDPLKAGTVQKTSALSPAESLRAIRLQLLHHIFDFLRGFQELSPGDYGSVQSANILSGSAGNDSKNSWAGSYGQGYGKDLMDLAGSFGSIYAGVKAAGNPADQVGVSSGSLWEKVTTNSYFYAESEETSFESKGVVQCADGRTIEFGVSFSMSRSFSAIYEEVAARDYFFTDPLVINLDTDITGVSDQKFLFDLDGDGEQENISFAGKGSGFLALDKNDDGIINDGTELFGTKSGNGFKDLAEYDSDGNGWIDEADDIYNRLKIWVKNDDGSDSLINLKEADVGAIFLGNVSTGFSFNDAENKTNAMLRNSGMFLRESGGAGIMAHVDLETGKKVGSETERRIPKISGAVMTA